MADDITVLLVDDFCTEGHSFEAGRALVEATGARVICLSWLKTIKTDYRAIHPPVRIADPFAPVPAGEPLQTRSYGYNASIVSNAAELDLADVHRRYATWDWPKGI